MDDNNTFTHPQIRAEAAYLYDAVHLYGKALISVLREGGSARNGTAIVEQMKGQKYLSAMGYMVQIDDNADASGNYTLLALSGAMPTGDNGTGPIAFGLLPVGTFGALDAKNRLPVRTFHNSSSSPRHSDLTYSFIYSFSSMSNSRILFIGWQGGHQLLCHHADSEGRSVSVSTVYNKYHHPLT